MLPCSYYHVTIFLYNFFIAYICSNTRINKLQNFHITKKDLSRIKIDGIKKIIIKDAIITVFELLWTLIKLFSNSFEYHFYYSLI